MKNILFISVDGVQNYLKSLFMPIFSKVQDKNINIKILEFCPNDDTLRKDIFSASKEYGVHVYFGRYFNKPPVIGSLLFILYGAIRTLYVVKKNKIDILMPRSLLAGAMAILVQMIFRKIEIIYESDGLMSDERVDFGSWKQTGILYKLFQAIERKLVRDSKIIITRTNKGKRILLERSPNVQEKKFYIIPNGKDSSMFAIATQEQRLAVRKKYNIGEKDLLFIYVGSVGGKYRLDIMIKIFQKVSYNIKKSKLLILTPNIDFLKENLHTYGQDVKNIIVDKVNPSEVSKYIGAADIGLSIITPAYSMQGVSPLKVIEYLMCGLPIVTNSGVGDLDDLLDNNKVGYIIKDLKNIDNEDLFVFAKNIVDNFTIDDKKKIRDVAIKYFDLTIVIERYHSSLQ